MMQQAAQVVEWWTSQQAGMLGGGLGGGLGGLAGLLGAAMGVLAPKGKGRWILVPSTALLLLAGIILALLGALALLQGQPYHVYYPLLLAGGVLTCVLSGILPVVVTFYRVADAMKVDRSTDDGQSPTQGPVQPSPGLSPAVAQALIDMWGDRGDLRRWCVAAAWVATPIALFGLSWAVLRLVQSQPLTTWLPALIVGIEFAVLAGIAIGTPMMMGAQLRQLAKIRERQRLDAAEFRRA